VLNYGHTFGHALESASNYEIPHGIAVLYGMYMINQVFYNDKYHDINTFIMNIIPETLKNIKIPYDIFISHVLNDKKNNGTEICFILLDDIGKTVFAFKKIKDIEERTKIVFSSLFGSTV
jgi:3-dehydroquinate synthase